MIIDTDNGFTAEEKQLIEKSMNELVFVRSTHKKQPLYRPSVSNGKNTIPHVSGRGSFTFVLGLNAVLQYTTPDGIEVDYSPLTMEILNRLFSYADFRVVEVDELDNIQFGHGDYSNTDSPDWEDKAYLPEAYIEFSEY